MYYEVTYTDYPGSGPLEHRTMMVYNARDEQVAQQHVLGRADASDRRVIISCVAFDPEPKRRHRA